MRYLAGIWLLLPMLGAAASGAPETETAGRNRLADETSPYLRAHADNPVHWYAWGQAAFDAAKKQNKPIFLSIGYSSCHWCHVMNRETFANPEIAKLLNEHFICIKVDREERPDVDKVYMNAVQAISGHGGWPLSAFLLPDGRPFFGGTYFPPEDREVEGGVMPGFPRVLRSVLDALETKRKEIEEQAAGLSDYLRHQATAVILNPAPLTKTVVEEAVQGISQRVDPEHAGFSSPPNHAPKFPQPSMGLLLIEYAAAHKAENVLQPISHQAKRMALGGIYDQVGGGFHRYTIDREWVVPHFEKMLYDQAQLLSLYSRLYTLEKDPLYQRVVAQTVEFLRREMMTPETLFYSALDADSEHEEGKFYVWSTDELRPLLGSDFDWVAKMTGVVDGPNFEGRHILVMKQTLAQAAKDRGVTQEQLASEWDAVRAKLLSAREKRVRPLLDTKVITAWNALTVVGLADAAEAFNDAEYRELAVKAARQMLVSLRKQDGTLYRHWIGGAGKGEGFADDYAATALAMLAAHRLQPDDVFLDAARSMTAQLQDRYFDPRGKGYFYTGKTQESLVAPLKESYDGAIPSANSLAALAFVQLAERTGQQEYRKQAWDTFQAFSNDLNGSPAGSTVMVRALDRYFQAGDADQVLQNAPPKSPAAGKADPAIAGVAVAPEVVTLKAGQTVTVQIQISINRPWHLNANPASPDYLQPTQLQLAKTDVITQAKFQYPKGEPLSLPGFDDPVSVYQGKAIVTAELTAAATAPAGEHALELDLRYQACDDKRCLAPARKRVPLVVHVTR